MLYRILKFLIGIGIRLYYSEIKINGKQHLNTGKPLIIIANHPNTLMDAWVIGMICKQPIYYMAKATLFDSKFKLKLLKGLNMIPINRAGEGKIKGVSNDSSFEACYQCLEEGKTLVIFPEGTSYKERILRKLKTGTARIALEVENRNNGNLGLEIIAVGINYLHPEKFRSRIFVNIDHAQNVLNYYEEYNQDKSKTAHKLTANFRSRLEKVLVTTEDKEEDDLIERLHETLNSKYLKNKEKGVKGEVHLMRDLTEAWTEIRVTQPWLINDIKSKLASIQWRIEKLKIKSDFLDRRFRSTMFFRQMFFAVIFVLLGLPLFLFGLIHNIFQFVFTDWIIPKLTKDIEYYAPFAIFIGLFLYPLIYIGFVISANYSFNLSWITLIIYFLAMPLSGLFAYWFRKYLKHVSYKWKFMLLVIDKNEALTELKADKEALRNMIFNAQYD